jgi:hypothetical protein
MLLVLTSVVDPAFSAEGEELWSQSYGGSSQDWGLDAKVTEDGGFILTGFTKSFGVSGSDVYLVKLDAAGIIQWDTPLGSAANDVGYAVIQTDDGYVVAGNQNIGSDNTKQGLLIKVDTAGQEQWQETYGGSGKDEFFDVVECAGGGFAMAGVTTSIGPGGHAAWIVRVDDAGTLLWQNAVALDGRGFDNLTGLVETASGDFVASGYSGDGVTFPSYDAEMAAFNGTGDLLWTRTFDHSDYDRAYDITLAPEDGFALAGPSAYAMTIWRTDPNGSLVWLHRFNTVTGDHAEAVVPTSDGGFLVGGNTWNYDDGAYQMYVGKTDAAGNALWERLYGGPGREICRAIAETPSGDYAFAGTTDSFGAGGDDMLLLLAEGSDGPTSVTGPGSALERSLAVYPNPFNPNTTIGFDLSAPARTNVTIVDARGRHVRTILEDAALGAGQHTLRWDGRDDTGLRTASGVYFVRAHAAERRADRKLVLIR